MENNNNGIYDYELVYIKEEKKKYTIKEHNNSQKIIETEIITSFHE